MLLLGLLGAYNVWSIRQGRAESKAVKEEFGEAAGTSMPELVTTIVASLRGQRDLAVGNVVGSNLFDILGVLGVAVIVAPQGIPVSEAALALDIPIMIATAVACLPIFFTGHRIARWGGLFFLYYLAYVTYLVLDATGLIGSQAVRRAAWQPIAATAIVARQVPFRHIVAGAGILEYIGWRRAPDKMRSPSAPDNTGKPKSTGDAQ